MKIHLQLKLFLQWQLVANQNKFPKLFRNNLIYITKNTIDINAFVKPETIRPRKTPAAALIDFSKFLFKNNSPAIAPINAPNMIPNGGKNKPIKVPIEAPIIPNLLAPNFFEVYIGIM